MNPKPGLLCLPDDILILILGHLDFPTQLKMTHMHLRFLEVMPHVWRSRDKSANLSLIELHLSDKDLRFFLGSTQRTLNALRLKMEKRSNFDVLTNYVFPKLDDFRFSTHSFSLNDSDLPKMIRSFPNLKTFSPHGRFTGKHLVEFQFLENLTLSYCSKFEVSNLIHILKTRNIKSLKLGVFDTSQLESIDLPLEGIKNVELLQCDCEEMRVWFLRNLEHLTHLKQLFLCGQIYGAFVWEVLRCAKRSNIRILDINFYEELDQILNLNVQIQTMKVGRLIRVNRESRSLLNFENIKEIYFKDSVFDELGFKQIINSLKTTEILGLSDCKFGFKEFTFLATEIAKERHKTLNIYLGENLVCHPDEFFPTAPIIWKVDGEHMYFKLRTEHPKISYGCDPVSIYFD
ncbi:uncharacterized protein LOC108141401 isoform X2 [Drosophila elegans]|uniref:uncharacterized protein LOC108141401 isoform X2 n=1 Tax=Drosophila elegans TaxID=30023 RepID=UPI0007E73FFA|nr:uncharacterized protein LOC108141401 isoform X2 [Drosophila elegans]